MRCILKVFLSLSGAALSAKAKEFLAYLVHSKDHVLNQGQKHPLLEEVLKKRLSVCRVTLYRGCSDAEFALYNSGKPIPYYTSFSESRAIAARFGKNLITIKHGKGFNYWDYLVKDLNELRVLDPDGYESIDGDFLIETVLKEREWILPFGLKKS